MSTTPFETTPDQPVADPIPHNETPRARDDSVTGLHAVSFNLDCDVIIVGAGLSGILSLHHLRELGMRAKVPEAGSAEGGTWFW